MYHILSRQPIIASLTAMLFMKQGCRDVFGRSRHLRLSMVYLLRIGLTNYQYQRAYYSFQFQLCFHIIKLQFEYWNQFGYLKHKCLYTLGWLL